jgi:hypothetical protein
MARLVEDLSAAIAAAFETDEYRNRHQQIEAELAERHDRAVNEMSERAKGEKILLVRTPSGFAFGPLGKDGVMGPEEFSRLAGPKLRAGRRAAKETLRPCTRCRSGAAGCARCAIDPR